MAQSFPPIYDITKSYEQNLIEGPNKAYTHTTPLPVPSRTYQLLGLTITSPFGSSACPNGCDSAYINATFNAGFDIVTTKTRRSVSFQPHPMRNIVHIVPGKLTSQDDFKNLSPRKIASSSEYKTLTVANSFGNNSIDPKIWVTDDTKANDNVPDGKLLISSIVGTIQKGFSQDDYYNDFATVAKLALKTGARAIEINFSCPNVANEGVLCYDGKAVLTVCRLVKQAIGNTPLIAKLGYFPPIADQLLEATIVSIDPFISAVSAINTFAAPVYDGNNQQALPGIGRLKAGLSGQAIKDIGLDMTKRLCAFRQRNNLKFEIISIGGVLTAKDFLDYKNLGANAVLSGTGAMWNPNLAADVKAHLQ
jgi:dihydroorotate dehydrogenase (NAD+) catalytic subunit